MNLTQQQKQTLADYCATGGKVYSIAYYPYTVGSLGGTIDPEGDAVAAGLILWLRTGSKSFVEAIYTSSVV